jgi:hypothetical protein
MKTNIIAIDPGANGGIAWYDSDGGIGIETMPEGMTAQADRLIWLKNNLNGDTVAIVEKTGGYMPGNSGPAAVKFARHCGHIEAILYCLGIPTEQVAPQTWMKALGALPKEKKERKNAIKELMARAYPALTVTLSTADALGILTFRLKEIYPDYLL